MPRGKHHQSDVSVEYRSKDYPHKEGRSTYDNRTQRDVKDGDRRARENRNRGQTSPSHHELPTYRDHHHQTPSRMSRDTSEYQSDTEYHSHQQTEVLYNLRYTLTTRGLCQLMQVFVSLLIIICAGVPYSNNGGYRDLASLGGVYAYYFGGAGAFTGADAQRVKELDQLFHQLKRPPYIFAMTFGGVLMTYACVMFVLGVFRAPYRWPPLLLGEALLSLLIGLGHIPAIAFYFIKMQETYSSPICKEREQMYNSKGHKGFDCTFNGADIAGGLFGVLGVFIFIFSAVLAVRAFRSVRELKKQNTNEINDYETGLNRLN
ncbi:MARVEL domain-containing protein 3 [Nothobranchius furzeri]|nr:MARVEL domain containing 3 [Nothobranchius furzeri]